MSGHRLLVLERRLGMDRWPLYGSAKAQRRLGGRPLGETRPRLCLDRRRLAGAGSTRGPRPGRAQKAKGGPRPLYPRRCRPGIGGTPRHSVERLARWSRVHWSISELKSAPPKESCQLDVNLRHALVLDGMALRHVAAKRVWRYKAQFQTYRRSPRIQHLKQPPIGNPLLAARKDCLNILNRLVQDAHKT